MGFEKQLQLTASKLSRFLKDLHRGSDISWPEDLSPFETDTGGCCSVIAKVGRGRTKTTLELWLDEYAGSDAKRYSLTLSDTRLAVIDALASNALGDIATTLQLTDQDYAREGDVVRLRRPLSGTDFLTAVCERYPKAKRGYYTVYFPRPQAVTREVRGDELRKLERYGLLLLDTAVQGALADGPEEQLGKEGSGALEGLEVLALHKRRERSSQSALRAKRRDGYRCQVCEFSFLVQYGELGRGYAEAHHTIYLSRTGERDIPLSELVTVCANCHRMLHRMGNGPEDVETLRALIADAQSGRKAIGAV